LFGNEKAFKDLELGVKTNITSVPHLH